MATQQRMRSVRPASDRMRTPPGTKLQGSGRRGGRARGSGEQLATVLGLFSIGLGLAQLLAPRAMTSFVGLRTDRGMMPLFGLREIATGIGILARPHPTGWVAARVAGDAMDLAMLAAGSRQRRADRRRLAGAAAAVLGVAAIDAICTTQLRREPKRKAAGDGAVRAIRTITVNRPAEELYRFWRNFENLPRVMGHIDSVRKIDDLHSHWVARAPGGYQVEWDSEITYDQADRQIAWRSLPGADVPNAGSVRFDSAPGGRGTEIRVELTYRPPAGALGAAFAKLLGQAPEQQTMEDLRRFKQLMETGEIATTDGQTSGRKGGLFGGRLSLTRILEKEAR